MPWRDDPAAVKYQATQEGRSPEEVRQLTEAARGREETLYRAGAQPDPQPSQEQLTAYVERLRREGTSEQEIKRLLRTPELRHAAATYLGGEPAEEVAARRVPPAMHEATAALREAPRASETPIMYPQQQGMMMGMQPGVMPGRVGVPGTGRIEREMERAAATHGRVMERFGQAAEGERQAIQQWQQTEEQAARSAADVYRARSEQWEQLQHEHAEKQKRRQDHVREEMDKLRMAVDDFKGARIDPYRFYRHADGSVDYPKSIAAAIAIGMGALGSTLPASRGGGTGGPNVALQLIDRAIDRDIDAQKHDIQTQQAEIGLQGSLLGQMRSIYEDDRQWENATRFMMLESAKMKIEEVGAQYADKRVQDQAAMMISEIDTRQAAITGEMEITAAREAVGREAMLFGSQMQRAQMLQQQADRQAAMMTAQLQTQLPKPLSEKQESEITNLLSAIRQVEGMHEQWKTHQEERPAGGYPPNILSRQNRMWEDYRNIMAVTIAKAHSTSGTLSPRLIEKTRAMVPNVDDSEYRAKDQINSVARQLRQDLAAKLRGARVTGRDIPPEWQRYLSESPTPPALQGVTGEPIQ